MFSKQYLSVVEEIYRALHFAKEQLQEEKEPEKEVARLIQESTERRLSFQELGFIARATDHVEILEEEMRKKFRSENGEVKYIAPTFQTNACMDICGECGWNRFEKTKRVTHSPEQFGKQLKWLKDHGFGVIEISNGTNPQLLQWDSLKKYMSVVKEHIDIEKGEGFGICSAAFDQDVFEKLVPEFMQYWVQWMETYDLASYFTAHTFTAKIPGRYQRFSKANFMARLDSYDTVMRLGGDVMLGVQYGINGNDPTFDTLMTIAHARYLEDTYGRTPLTFGTVKNNMVLVKQEKYADKLHHQFSDEEYRTQLVTYKAGMPQIGRWLNTRVPFELIRNAIVDNDFYTGDCSDMVPGRREGLTQLENKDAGQFSVHELSKQKWEQNLSELGLRANYSWMNPTRYRQEKVVVRV